MASMFSNVLGYLCPNKPQETTGSGRTVPRVPQPAAGDDTSSTLDRENTCSVAYGIEDQDDWQIVRKMSDASSMSSFEEQEDCLDDGSGEALFALDEDDTGMEDTENRRPSGRACPNSWYLAPPPCFSRNAAIPSTNPLENLLIEHPSMSVYLLPVAASSSRRAALYRSAPPLIMEEHLAGGGRSSTASPARTAASPTPAPLPVTTQTTPHRLTHSKRKRRVRSQRHCAVNPPNGGQGVPAAPTAADLGVRTADEQDKQLQNEEKDRQAGRKLLAKNQLQRGNLVVEVAAGQKKRAHNREGNYRCLH